MYTNIPRKDIINIIKNISNNTQIQVNIRKEMTYILKKVMEQNYFQFDQKYCKQTEGLAMGAPTLALVVQIYIYNILNTDIYTQF
jgi:hypothetical protein